MSPKTMLLIFLVSAIGLYTIHSMFSKSENIIYKKKKKTKDTPDILILLHVRDDTQKAADLIVNSFRASEIPDRVYWAVFVDTTGINVTDVFYYFPNNFIYASHITIISNNVQKNPSRGTLHAFHSLLASVPSTPKYSIVVSSKIERFRKRWDANLTLPVNPITSCANGTFPVLSPSPSPIPKVECSGGRGGGPASCICVSLDFLFILTSELASALEEVKNLVTNRPSIVLSAALNARPVFGSFVVGGESGGNENGNENGGNSLIERSVWEVVKYLRKKKSWLKRVGLYFTEEKTIGVSGRARMGLVKKTKKHILNLYKTMDNFERTKKRICMN